MTAKEIQQMLDVLQSEKTSFQAFFQLRATSIKPHLMDEMKDANDRYKASIISILSKKLKELKKQG